MNADYNLYTPRKKEKFLVSAVFFLALTLAGYIFYGIFLFGFALPAVYRPLMKKYCRYRAAKRKNALLLQFRDFLYSLSASFATGRHMTEAMEEASAYLTDIYGSEGEMVQEIGCMLRRIREAGETDLSVLEDFSHRSALSDAEDFAQLFRACRESGGNLTAAVNRAASLIGEKIGIETEIRTMVSQKKLEGKIITAMPAVVVLFLQLVSPDYLQIMYQTFPGRALMTAALLAICAAYVMIERITAIEV